MSFIKKIVESGVSYTDTKSERRNIILSNYISISVTIAPILWLVARIILDELGFSLDMLLIVCCSLLFSLPIILNGKGFIHISRFILCWLPSFFVVVITIILMKHGSIYDTASFVGVRFFLLSFCCFPFLIFDLKSTSYLILCLFLPAVALLLFDPILNFFNVGYWQSGHTDELYPLTNVRVLLAFLVISFSFYFLKRLFENSDTLNEKLLTELARQNKIIQEHAAQEVNQLNKQLKINVQQLKEREYILNDSQRIARIGSWEYRTKDEFLFCSDEMYNIFGLDKNSELKPRNLLQLMWGEQSGILIKTTKHLLETGETYDLTLNAKTPFGYTKWVRIYATPIVDNKKIIGVRGICHDITHYKEAEELLRNSEYKYRSLFEQASDAIMITDFEGNFIDVNASFSNMLGYTKTDLLHLNISNLIQDEQLSNEPVRLDMLIKGERLFSERKMRHRNGTLIEVESNVKMFGENRIMAISRDITIRKRTEQEKEYTRYLLNERIKELTTLYNVSQVIHEEKNSVDAALQQIVLLLPPGWQYPEISAARITIGEKEFKTPNFRETAYYQRAELSSPQGTGMIEVVYLEEKRIEAEGPFLIEERNLINMIAEMLAVYLARKFESEELKKSEANLHSTINNTEILIWSIDRDFNLLTFNAPFRKFMKERYGVDIKIGSRMMSHINTPESQELIKRWSHHYMRALSGEVVSMEEARFEFFFQYSLSPIIIEGKIIGASVFANNITERKVQEQKLAEANKKIGESKLIALRSVMSPHFIFNVLNSIQFYIAKNDRLNAINYLSTFSKLIRSILTHSVNNKIRLTDEIELLNNYVQLEMTRFENKFEYNLTVDPEVDIDDIFIPSLLIQPYVENAILHGLYNKLEKGKLSIKISQHDEAIVFEIEDDGIGRDAAMRLREKNFPAHKSVGIKVTEERLKLINQNHHALFEVQDLKNDHGPCGTRVRILISES